MGDAGVMAGDPPGKGDEEAVVERDEDDHEGDGDDGEAGRRDVEFMGNAGVHGGALLDGEGLELGQAGAHDDGAAEYGDHAKDGLSVLHLGDSAWLPWAG